MKLELVGEEKLVEMFKDMCKRTCDVFAEAQLDHPICQRCKRSYIKGARDALEDLSVVQVVALDLDQRKRPSCGGCIFAQEDEESEMCALETEGHECIRKGPILVRAKLAEEGK